MEADHGWLSAVVARHTPAFFLHPSDAYMPCTVEFFMQHSELRAAAPGSPPGAGELLLPRGAVSPEALLEAQAAAPPGCRLWLDLDPAARTGAPKHEIDEVPVYALAKWVVGSGAGSNGSSSGADGVGGGAEHNSSGGADGNVTSSGTSGCLPEALEITYITFYAYNGHYNVGGVGLVMTGAHDGDVERITARVHPTEGHLLGMWYNAHRPRDGSWVAGAEVPRDPASGRHAAFVALHGHGTYPRPGRVLRHFFLGNDLTSSGGPVWRPRRVVLLPLLEGAAPPVPAVVDSAGSGAENGSSNGGGTDSSGQAPAGTRRLLQVPSRGSRLCRLADGNGAGSAGTLTAAEELRRSWLVEQQRRQLATSSGNGSSGLGSSNGGGSMRDLPEVITDDPCPWLWFRGNFGTIPFVQSWFHTAECPVSRSPLLRVVGHFVAERQRV